MEPHHSESEKEDIAEVIFAFFEAGKNKDLPSLGGLPFVAGHLHKVRREPPYTRQNSDEAFVYEQAAFANISEYSYNIDGLRIDLVGEVAIATFYLAYKGMFVNDYSFEGSPVSSKDRVTMILSRTTEGWRIVHEHFSRFPDWDPKKAG